MLSLIRLIRGHVFLFLILLVSIYSFANYFIIKLIVTPRHLQVEQQLAEQEVKRYEKALIREGRALNTIAHDWAAWDDTYAFVQDSNSEYIKSNLSDTTLLDGAFNLLYIVGKDGTIVWSRVIDLETEEGLALNELPSKRFPAGHPLITHPQPNDDLTGILSTEKGPLLFASHPIVTSENEGPIEGTLIFGRLLTKQFLQKLQEQAQVKSRIFRLDDSEKLAHLSVSPAVLTEENLYAYDVSKYSIRVYSLIKDYLGKPQWLLQVRSGRLLSDQSRKILLYVLVSNIALGVMTLFLFLLSYQYEIRRATSTFRGLIDQILPPDVKERRKEPLRRSFNTDEFSRLSEDLREMIAEFEQTKLSQKNIISQHSALLRQLNTKLVEEIKERLHIEKDLHQIKENLEEKVKLRTRELQLSNQALQEEIGERRRNEEELKKHRQRLRALSSELMEMEDKERRQIATDLHDQIGQSLSAVKMYVDALIPAVTDGETSKRLRQVAEIVDQTVQDTRTLTFELSPPVLYELGLGPALEWLSEEFHKKYGIEISATCDPFPQCTTSAFLALIFRTIRELLINVVRHAKAQRAEIQVRCSGKEICLTVKDDGCGIEVGDAKIEESGTNGFGLFSIRERIMNIGGTVDIDSKKELGTTITLTLPVQEDCSELNWAGVK